MVQSSIAQLTVALRVNTREIPDLRENALAFQQLFEDQAATAVNGCVHVPLALFGLNDWEERVEFQRVMTALRRPQDTDSDAEQTLESRARVTCAAEWAYELSLSPSADDALWAFTNALLLQMRSAGIYGRALLPARGSRSFALASAVSKVSPVKSDEQRLDWSGRLRWIHIAVEDARSSALVEIVHLAPAANTLSSLSTQEAVAPPLRYPKLVGLVDELLVYSAQTEKPAVVILRGIPGSGKSTLGREIASICSRKPATCTIVSADRYFVGPRGYVFDVKHIGKAHDTCKSQFEDALRRNNANIVIVDNTHTQSWEYEHYVQRARANRCRVQVLEMHCPDLTTCIQMAKRNSHGVPVPKVIQMYLRWDADSSAMAFSPQFEHAMVNRNPISRSTASSPVYVGLFIDSTNRAKLLHAFPSIHANVIADHVTLFYRPTKGYLRDVEIGDEVLVRATELVQDGRGQCLRVELASSLSLKVHNKIPHITLSTANDVAAYYSNELLENSRATRTVLADGQQVCVTARVGVVVLTQNQRATTVTSPFASSLSSTQRTVQRSEEISRIVMVRVDEKSVACAVTAAHTADSLLASLALREQIRHQLGSPCHTLRVLCLAVVDTSSTDRVLQQLEALLLLSPNDRHQFVFDKIVVVRSDDALSAAGLREACGSELLTHSIMKIVVLSTLPQDLSAAAINSVESQSFSSALVSVSRLELSEPESSSRSGVLSAPFALTVNGAMDCLSLGIQERTRFEIHNGMRLARSAWEAVLGSSAPAVVERIDSSLVGWDSAVIHLCALTSGSDDLDSAQLRLTEELTAAGVHHVTTGLEPGTLYFTTCSSAEYSPVFRLQIVDSADTDSPASKRLAFCRKHREHVNELRETESYATIAALLSATLRAHCLSIPGDCVAAPTLDLMSERLALCFLKQSPNHAARCSTGSRGRSNSEVDSEQLDVLRMFSTLLQSLSDWKDDKWNAELASAETLFGSGTSALVGASDLSQSVKASLSSMQHWDQETRGAIYQAHNSGKRSTAVLQALLALVQPQPVSAAEDVVRKVVEVTNASNLLDVHIVCDAMRKTAASEHVNAEKAFFACAPSALLSTRVEVAAASQELLAQVVAEAQAHLERLELAVRS